MLPRFCMTATILLLLLASLPEVSAETSIFNIAPSFPSGPYSSLYVDRANPQRLAIGTMDGRVAWSENAAQRVVEAKVSHRRFYDAMAIRGGATNAGLGGGDGGDAGSVAQRSVRLFIRTLGTGKGIVRWMLWRAIADPMTDITSIALPVPGGNMMATTSAGIMIADPKGGSWIRTLGAPGNMPKENIDLVGLSVVANPENPDFVLAGTTKGVYRSRDGGMTFTPHTNKAMTEEMIFEFLWDQSDPDVVLAVGADSILQSEDRGETFELAFVAPSELNAVVSSDRGVFVASTDGLTLVTGDGNVELIKGESVIGVVTWPEDQTLALTTKNLYLLDAYGERKILMRTTDTDPFLRLDGNTGLAYLLTQTGLFRISDQEEKRQVIANAKAPQISMSLSVLQSATMSHLGLGGPDDTRIHPRWYAKLLPDITFDAVAVQKNDDSIMKDYTLPIDLRFARGNSGVNAEFSIMANWDLSSLLFGDDNAANPDLFIESTLRGNRQRILSEVRMHYREAAFLAKQLQTPPQDPMTDFLWRMRLEEHTSYLHYVSGRELLKEPQELIP